MRGSLRRPLSALSWRLLFVKIYRAVSVLTAKTRTTVKLDMVEEGVHESVRKQGNSRSGLEERRHDYSEPCSTGQSLTRLDMLACANNNYSTSRMQVNVNEMFPTCNSRSYSGFGLLFVSDRPCIVPVS